MLKGALAALPGAALAQSPPSLVSLWAFDETSGAQGMFEDRGPADLPISLVGSWMHLNTGSLVRGIGGASAYTDGTAYATIPANQASHDLAALTISFYYQRDSAAARHILLAAGNGSRPGDFQIEVLANGRLRGRHTGQDGARRYFQGSSGITGANLEVGTAHRIDLSLGPEGAHIYFDGAEAGAILENINAWNNARVKYLGRWTDGGQAPAVGVFDHLRIWNRQLTSDMIALLEPAQSVVLPDEPDEPDELRLLGAELSVPSLAEWLRSDLAGPTPTKYVSNQNRGNGSGSSPANAQEVQAALNGASRGQNFIAVCQTPGTIEFWNYPDGLDFRGTLSGSGFITLRARQGDGVVISAGEDFKGRAPLAAASGRRAGSARAIETSALALGRHLPGRRADHDGDMDRI